MGLQQGRLIRRPFKRLPILKLLGLAPKSFRGHGDRSELQKLKVATKFFRGSHGFGSTFWRKKVERKLICGPPQSISVP
jgi:hypothetical protein